MELSHTHSEDVPLDHELAQRSGWFVQLRWLVGAAVLVGSTAALLVADGRSVVWALYATGVAILGYNVLLARFCRGLLGQGAVKAIRWRLFVHVQVALDWVALTVLAALTGGLESPLLLFFVFHVILAAMLLPRRECFAQTTVGFLLVALMAWGRWLGVPLHVPRSPFAVVHVYGHEGRTAAYALAIAAMFYICAFLVATVAERLRLRERDLLDAKNREQRMHAQMALLHELSKSITATLDLDLVLQRVAEQATRIMQAKACTIRLVSESGEMQVSAAYGLSQAYLDKGPVELARSPVDRKALMGQTVLIHDVTEEDLFQYPEEAAREGIRSVLCVPLMAGHTALGVVRVYGDRPGAFDREDVETLERFASLAAIAINNARACRMLQDLDRERSQFVRMVAHELRSPLAAILGNLRIILEGYVGEVPERIAQLLSRTHRRGTGLLALVGDLLALVSGRDGANSRPREWVSLDYVARHVVNDMSARAREKHLDLQVAIGDGPLEVFAERDQIERLMDNLVSNAVKYTPEGGRVTVRLKGDEESAQLIVEDTGIGIPRAMLDRVFEEFYRAENAKRLTDEGTGLGLSIVKRIVENHRGKIAVESEEGRGTRVTVVLPRKDTASAASENASTTPLQQAAS